MTAFGYFVMACVAIALLQRVMVFMVIALCGLILWGVFFRPAGTFGLLALGAITNLLRWNPWAGLAVIGLIAVLAWGHPQQEDE